VPSCRVIGIAKKRFGFDDGTGKLIDPRGAETDLQASL
jgi:hypothetical protein